MPVLAKCQNHRIREMIDNKIDMKYCLFVFWGRLEILFFKVAKVKSESSEDFDNARESYSEVTTKEITANLVFKNENRENTTIVGQNGNHQGSENEEDNMEDVSQYLKVEIDDDKQEAEIVIENSEEEIVCEPQLECGEENAEGLEEGNGGDEMFTDDLSLLSTVICNLCGVTLLTGEVSRHFKRQHPEASRAETTKQRTMWHWYIIFTGPKRPAGANYA